VRKILGWAKSNIPFVIVFVIALYLLFINISSGNIRPLVSSIDMYEKSGYGGMGSDVATIAPSFRGGGAIYNESAPQLDITDRKVITESTMSLLVKDVRQALSEIQDQAESLGGYMVNTYLSSPEEADQGNITVRVPKETLKSMLSYLRNYPVRVVSENINGRDVTDQYIDIESRLETLNKTKTIYENLLEQATEFEDIMNAQQMILSVQDQIDRYKGQLQYLDATAKAPKITVYLATDELELPYSPGKPWRPSVVFKYATRSLISTLRGVGSAAIWVGVYAIIWLPALIIFIAIKKTIAKRKEAASQQ